VIGVLVPGAPAVHLPEFPEAMLVRLRSDAVTVAAVPIGVAVYEQATPEWAPTSGLTLTANPLRLWCLSEAEAAWYVENGAWVPFKCPPCLFTIGEIVTIVWGLKAPFADEIARYGSLCAWTGRDDAEEAEVHALDAALHASGLHPGWPIVPRRVSE
jgi:hypothetical protein